MVEAVLAPLAVGVQQHLGIGASCKAAPGALELAPHFAVVIDLAVEDDRDAIGSHRLDAALREVEDGEPAMTESHPDVVAVFPLRDVPHQHVGEPALLGPGE